MWMAKAKQATTIANQRALAILDLAVDMWTRPWIVELSRKSLKVIDAIFGLFILLSLVQNRFLSCMKFRLEMA